MNKYIDSKILNWLLEKSDPEIRYQTLKYFFDRKTYQLHEQQQLVEGLPEARHIIENSQNHIIGDSKYFDIFYRGTVWNFARLAEFGLTCKTETMQQTADYILKNWQLKSGGFTMNWKPFTESTAFTGAVLKSFLQADYYNDEVLESVTWLLDNQNSDGGWAGSSITGVIDSLGFILLGKSSKENTNVNKRDRRSCPYATLSVLEALLLYNSKKEINHSVFEKAVTFIFNEKILAKKSLSSRDNFYHNKNIYKIGYPVVLQYDIVKILLLIAQAGFFADTRINEAFNYLIKLQNNDGSWDYQSYETGMIYNKKNKKYTNKSNKWATLNVLRLFKYADSIK